MSFLSLAESFKIGAFFFKGQTYFIEKKGNSFSVILNGKKVADLKGLKAYYSNGEDRVLFVLENKEIVWANEKRYRFGIKLNPILDFKKPKFYKLLLKNNRFALICDVNPSVLDTESGKIFYVPSLFYKNGRGLFLVSPDNVVFFSNSFVYFSKPYLIAYSIKEKQPVLIKKLDFDFVSCSGVKNSLPYFQFDYEKPVFVDVDNRKVQIGEKEKNDNVIFYGNIGDNKGLKVTLEISDKGFTPAIDTKFRVYRGSKLIFEKQVKSIKINLNNLTSFRPFVFRQLEKAIAVNFPDETIILCLNRKGKIDLKEIDSNKAFSIVNGRVFIF